MGMSLDPPCASEAPTGPSLTEYDWQHIATYLRLLDVDREGADWREVAQIILHIDADADAGRAQQAVERRILGAKWMTEHGYRLLLRSEMQRIEIRNAVKA